MDTVANRAGGFYIMINTIIIAAAFVTVLGLIFFLLIYAMLAMGKAICEDIDKNEY